MGLASRRRLRRQRTARTAMRRSIKLQELATFPPFVGVYDDALPPAMLERLAGEARALWAKSGGARTSAKSYWVDAAGPPPRSALGALARGVIDAHFGGAARAAVAGAEVWAQRRSGRGERGLEFHFDKDERALDADEDDWRHPALATATYLASAGAPLLVFDTGSAAGPPRRSPERAWVVAPRAARHVAFAGDRLHGVPDEIATAAETRGERLSVLVNVWTSRPRGLADLGHDDDAGEYAWLHLATGRENRAFLPLARVAPGADGLHELAEHRAGDTGPIPLAAWRAAAAAPAAALELRYVGTS